MYKMYMDSDMISFFLFYMIVAVLQSLSHVHFFVTPQTTAHQASLSFTISWSLLKLMSNELVMPSYHLFLSSASPPALSLSQHQGLSPGSWLTA